MGMARFYWLPLCLIVLGINAAFVSGQCQDDQQSLLLNLKAGLSFDDNIWTSKLVTWDPRRDCCNWEGVSCDPGGLGRVVGLDLSEALISDWSPSGIFSISSLRYLRSLNLAYNEFNTTIPGELASLTELVYLNLSNAGFIGQVPIQLSQMTKLVTLDLSFTLSFEGFYFPNPLVLENPNLRSLVRNLSQLTELYLDAISPPGEEEEWWQTLSSLLPNLQVLSLSNCGLSGPIDASLKNLEFLSIINLSINNFSTPILDTIFQIPSLKTLDLSDNNLNIYLPKFYHNQSLQNLIISYTTILGGLPQSLGYLKNLSSVKLDYCDLTGTIPSSMANLTQLVSLDLSSNQLTGVVPSFHKLRNLQYLYLSNNQLSGEIPSSYLQGVQNLNKLDLSYNRFSGSIPPSLFEIPPLQEIQLSHNQFGGQIPDFPSASTSQVNIIDLRRNNLVGSIPRSVFNLSRLKFLDLSSNKLNGSIQLDWVRKLANLTTLDLSHNTLTVHVTSNESNLSPFPHFTTLKLPSCNLTKFPDLGNQPKLEYLDLSNNHIPEILPWLNRFANESLGYLNLSNNLLKSFPELTSFHMLYLLDVHGNQLSGKLPLPPPFAICVDYSSNNFNSSIPLKIGNSMTETMFFSLANNSLSGEIPESICNSTNLKVLDSSNNFLNDTIPACLIGGDVDLGVLDLRGNRLSGTIPDNFQAECGLRTLDLSSNVLHGSLPRSLARCRMLEVLDLGNNQIKDTFPCALRNHLPNLRVLILRNNQFHGRINCPAIRGNWDMLQILDLAQNQFNGTLPEGALLNLKAMMEARYESHGLINFEASIGYYQDSITLTVKGVRLDLVKILTIFTYIDFSCNQFEGPLPEAIGKFRALYLLNLSHNSFNGHILPDIWNLSQLESLDLSANNFSGAIPQQLSTLSFLSFLNVSGNKLTGEIPKGTQIQSFPTSSFEGNAELCGLPLPQPCHHISESMVPPSTAHEKPGNDLQFMVPAGMGFVVGVAAVIAPLIYDKKFNRWCDYHVNRICMIHVNKWWGTTPRQYNLYALYKKKRRCNFSAR